MDVDAGERVPWDGCLDFVRSFLSVDVSAGTGPTGKVLWIR